MTKSRPKIDNLHYIHAFVLSDSAEMAFIRQWNFFSPNMMARHTLPRCAYFFSVAEGAFNGKAACSRELL